MSGTTHQNSHGYIALGVSLAIGLVISAFIVASAIKTVKLANQSITVKGYAEKNLTADLAVWSSNISVRSQSLADGYTRLQQDLNKVKSYLQSKGIKSDMYRIGAVSTEPIYVYYQSHRSHEGYMLMQTITVTSNDVQGILNLATDASEIILQGVEFQSYTPEFYYTKLNDLKVEMLGEAAKDAKQRAEVLAKNSGSEVGTLKSAQQGIFQITAVNSTDISDYGEYNLSTIEKTIKSVVTMEFYTK